MPKITSFEDLECWKEGVALAVQIYRVSNQGELAKDFGLRDQIRKSAVSIPSNIAEGKERETVNEFIRFLYIAKGSSGELRTQLIISNKIGYLEDNISRELIERTIKISGMIGNLIKYLKKGRSR
jgi:four helix bundle protein